MLYITVLFNFPHEAQEHIYAKEDSALVIDFMREIAEDKLALGASGVSFQDMSTERPENYGNGF